MRTTLDIALNDLRIVFKDRTIWLNLIVIPIVVAVAVGFANGAGVSTTVSTVQIRVDVFDADNSAESARLLEAVRASNANLVLCPIDQTADDLCQYGDQPLTPALATARLEDKTALATLEIAAGFGAALQNGDPARLVYRSNESATAPSIILQAVNAAVTRIGGAQVAAQVGATVADDLSFLEFDDDADRAAFVSAVRDDAAAQLATQPIGIEVVSVEVTEQDADGTQGGFAQSIPGMATMYVLFLVLPAANVILLERKNWTLQRLATLPITRAQILGGKLLARFTLGLIQYAVLFGFGALVLGVDYGAQPLAIVPVMIAYTACVTALSLALTTFLTTDAQAQGIVLFVSLTLAPLGGAWWPLEIVPGWMRTVGHLSPVAWAMDGYREVIFFNGGLGEVLLPIALLAAATAALFVVGVARFRFTN